jgi:hypothetical protein
MQSCSHAVVQSCSRAVVQSCSHAVVQSGIVRRTHGIAEKAENPTPHSSCKTCIIKKVCQKNYRLALFLQYN